MQRIFAADIGGTNARFALFTAHGGNLTLTTVVWAKSADLGTTEDMLQTMQQLLQKRFSAGDALVIALGDSTPSLSTQDTSTLFSPGVRGTETCVPKPTELVLFPLPVSTPFT